MKPTEYFFATCDFCHKPEQLIVFDCSWRGQTSPTSKQYVRGGKFWLCAKCCKLYYQKWDNFDYDEKVNEMCEVLG